MKLVLLGAPGAGKGTQAVYIKKHFNIPHISTGDIFRQAIKEQTPVGIVAKGYIDKGQLVPDEITLQIVKDRLSQDDCKNGFLLDGFPRDIHQAEALENIVKLDGVINIYVPTEKLMHRLVGRRVCSKCKQSYHIDTLKTNICSECGGEIIHRDDDKEETVNKRLAVYETQTAPLIEFYEKLGILKTVDGDKPVEIVFESILKVLK